MGIEPWGHPPSGGAYERKRELLERNRVGRPRRANRSRGQDLLRRAPPGPRRSATSTPAVVHSEASRTAPPRVGRTRDRGHRAQGGPRSARRRRGRPSRTTARGACLRSRDRPGSTRPPRQSALPACSRERLARQAARRSRREPYSALSAPAAGGVRRPLARSLTALDEVDDQRNARRARSARAAGSRGSRRSRASRVPRELTWIENRGGRTPVWVMNSSFSRRAAAVRRSPRAAGAPRPPRTGSG